MTSCIKPLNNSRFYFATHLLLWNFVSTNSNLSGLNPSGLHHVQPGLLQCFGILVDPWWENPWRSWIFFHFEVNFQGMSFPSLMGHPFCFGRSGGWWVTLRREYHQVSASVHSISDTSSSMRLLFDYQLRCEWIIRCPWKDTSLVFRFFRSAKRRPHGYGKGTMVLKPFLILRRVQHLVLQFEETGLAVPKHFKPWNISHNKILPNINPGILCRVYWYPPHPLPRKTREPRRHAIRHHRFASQFWSSKHLVNLCTCNPPTIR